jgi:hypothetical protein
MGATASHPAGCSPPRAQAYRGGSPSGPTGSARGSASYASGKFTVQAAGSGVGLASCSGSSSNPDSFHFVYQPLSVDGTIVARVVSTSSTYAQAGVMIRETMDASAKSVLVGVYAGNIYTWNRELGGGNTGCFNPSVSASLPYWVKLARNGNGLTVFQSPDGFDWTLIGGPVEISMAQTVYIGLAVSSVSTSTLYSARVRLE